MVKYSGNAIVDVWVLENSIIQSEEHSDGWLFTDNRGNAVHIGGDMKSTRFNSRNGDWNKYVEYHMATDLIPYQEFYKIKGR